MILVFIIGLVFAGGMSILGAYLFILSQFVLLIIGIIKTRKHKDVDYGNVVLVNSVGLVVACGLFVIIRFYVF